MAQTRPSPTLSRGFTRLGRFLAPYGVMAGTRSLAQRNREPLSHTASRGSTAERHSSDIATVVRRRLATSRDRCGVPNRA